VTAKCKECGSDVKKIKCDNCGDFFEKPRYGSEQMVGFLTTYCRFKGGKKNGKGIGQQVSRLTICPKCVEEREVFITIVNPHREDMKNEQSKTSSG